MKALIAPVGSRALPRRKSALLSLPWVDTSQAARKGRAEAAEGEHGEGDERGGAVKAVGAPGDQADGGVGRLHSGVGEPVDQRGHDRLPVTADRAGELHEARKTGSARPADPGVEQPD